MHRRKTSKALNLTPSDNSVGVLLFIWFCNMVNAKEKAKEFLGLFEDWPVGTAKKHALVCVGQVIKSKPLNYTEDIQYYSMGDRIRDARIFWEEVKIEIEKL